jgi:uncharacterized protein (DUF302 family)
MRYIVETTQSSDRATAALDAAVWAHPFGATLRNEGIDFDEQSKVFEVCDRGQAAKELAADMRMNMALPSRRSVHTVKGGTCIGMIRQQPTPGLRSKGPALAPIPAQVKDATTQMIDEAAR